MGHFRTSLLSRPAGSESLPAVLSADDTPLSGGHGGTAVTTGSKRRLDHVDDLLAAVSECLAESTTRAEIDARIPAVITAQPRYIAGWIAQVDESAETLTVRAASGIDEPPAACPLGATPSAIQRAIETEQLHCCATSGISERPLGPEAAAGQRLLVVPLVCGPQQYGLLGVVSEKSTPLTDAEQGIVGSIGTLIATRLHAVEKTRLLTTEQAIELRVEIRDSAFELSRVAELVGAPVEFTGSTLSGDRRELYLTTGGSVENLDSLCSLPFVEAARPVDRTNGHSTLSVRTDVPLFETLASYGGVVDGITASADHAQLRVELPPEQDVRAVLDVLGSLYDGVNLQARTTRDRSDRQATVFTESVDSELTDRQRTALRAAHRNGFFEWPRPVDGSDVAETMGVTRQTFHQHLRAAERKLVAAYVDA